jgi:hypothetical protein
VKVVVRCTVELMSQPFLDAAPLPATALLHLAHRMLEAHGGGGGAFSHGLLAVAQTLTPPV